MSIRPGAIFLNLRGAPCLKRENPADFAAGFLGVSAWLWREALFCGLQGGGV